MKKSKKYKTEKILAKIGNGKNCLPFQTSFGENCMEPQKVPEPIKHRHQKPPVLESF